MVRDIMAAASGVDEKLEVESVFSTYLYTGNGSTLTINNGINLADEGGMVWIKGRSSTFAYHNSLFDTDRGVNVLLNSDTANADVTDNGTLTSFNSNGFSLDSRASVNYGNDKFVSWTFRKAPKFYTQALKVHTTGTPSTIDLSTLGVVGMVTVKSTVGISNWSAWHKDLTAGNNLKLNLTDAQSATNAYLSVSGTTLTISGSAPSDTYIVYAWAHDVGTDGIIQCGSFSGNTTTTIGWESQYIMIKRTDSTGDWIVIDSMRGCSVGGVDAILNPNLSNAENVSNDYIDFTATGFISKNLTGTYIYMVIRRPMKTPTSGTEVYNAIGYTGNSTDGRLIDTGFTTDFAMAMPRNTTTSNGFCTSNRLTGGPYLQTASTQVELPDDVFYKTSNYDAFSTQTGVYVGNDSDANINVGVFLTILYGFKRAKGFFDVVATSMTSSTINHSLGCTPELFITRTRTSASHWNVYAPSLYSGYMNLNETISVSTVYKASATATTVTYLGTYTSEPSIHYLFATLAGVSKVGSYNGNGTSQTIPCGFSTGARFILIKRTDSTGDWYIWDTTRGIVAANDPHLSLNTAAAEVTTDDSIDPESSGFIVNQVAATNINVNGGSYIFLAIA